MKSTILLAATLAAQAAATAIGNKKAVLTAGKSTAVGCPEYD